MKIDPERKFWIALGLFVILEVIAWETLGDGTVVVFGGPVEIRLIVAVVIATFAFRVSMARWANKIRSENRDGQ